MRVLIVDEDPALVEVLPPLLRREGHRVYLRGVVGDLAEFVAEEGIDLVVLDPSLIPFNLALDVCHSIRRDSAAMLLLVSRFGGVAERVRALEDGADDYLAKPADPAELLARVHALLRRHPLNVFGRDSGWVRVTEELWLDLAGQRLVGKEGELSLTGREFQLLAYLVRHEGMVLSREALLGAVWGPGFEGSTREIDVYVRYLRRKVEPDPRRPRYILSAWGRGYEYRRPESPALQSAGNRWQSSSTAGDAAPATDLAC